MFPGSRGKSCDLKVVIPQTERPFARQPLAAVSPIADRLYLLNSLEKGDESACV
jgi:hypothetical protein